MTILPPLRGAIVSVSFFGRGSLDAAQRNQGVRASKSLITLRCIKATLHQLSHLRFMNKYRTVQK